MYQIIGLIWIGINFHVLQFVSVNICSRPQNFTRILGLNLPYPFGLESISVYLPYLQLLPLIQ